MIGMKDIRVWSSVAIPVVTPAGWSCDEIATGMRTLERIRGELDAAFSELVTALGVSSRDAVAAITRATRVSSRTALHRVEVAEVTTKIPGAASALQRGDVRAEHLVLLRPVADDISDVDAQDLLDLAASESVDAFRKTVTKFQLDNDPKSFRDRQKDQRLVSFFKADHGCTGVRIVLTPVEGEELRNRLHQIADATWRAEHPERAKTLGGHDAAPMSQRLADAFMQLLRGTAASSGKPTIVVTVDAQTLDAEISGTGPVPLEDVVDLFDRAEFFAAIRDTKGEILKFGRSKRFASAMQKLALTVRDGGCVWEGCNAHWSKTDVHHEIEYDHGGLTDIEWLARLCKAHHTHLHLNKLRLRRVNGQIIVEYDPNHHNTCHAA
jgi:Domain of unknown function (DUF222)